MALVLMVVAPERFRDEELFDTQAELVQAGHQTVIASTRVGVSVSETSCGTRKLYLNSRS